jgi:IclR family acetate operon transcriptional repressor
VRHGTPAIGSLNRALRFLSALTRDGGDGSVSAAARGEGIPRSTAYRIVRTLVESGYLVAVSRNLYIAGPALSAMARSARPNRVLAAAARACLTELAKSTGWVAHLGVLEDDMVTYLVKAGTSCPQLFTKEGMQLEAYCSAIGKVLLADLPEVELTSYLSGGPLVALTANTKTDPAELRLELERVRALGFARDDREIAQDLTCLAVPVRGLDGRARAAVSLSKVGGRSPRRGEDALLSTLRETADAVARQLARASG